MGEAVPELVRVDLPYACLLGSASGDVVEDVALGYDWAMMDSHNYFSKGCEVASLVMVDPG